MPLIEIQALIRTIKASLDEPGIDQSKARRALVLAEQAARLPDSVRRNELIRDARQLLQQARGQS
jgi:hypothetical protein